VLVILWLALRSVRIILAVVACRTRRDPKAFLTMFLGT
jgi:hypothetical protein